MILGSENGAVLCLVLKAGMYSEFGCSEGKDSAEEERGTTARRLSSAFPAAGVVFLPALGMYPEQRPRIFAAKPTVCVAASIPHILAYDLGWKLSYST